MLRYNEWKQLNESFLGPVTLGLGNVQSLGIQGAHFTLEDLQAIEEAAKKGKKKMFGDDPGAMNVKDKSKDDDDDDKLEGDDDDDSDDIDSDDDSDDSGKDDDGGGAKKKDKSDKGDDKGDDGAGCGPMMKKGGKGGKKKCEEVAPKAPVTEDEEWWQSLQNQLCADPNRKFSDGTEYLHKEDAVIPPTNANSQLIADEPAPGEVGHAAQQRFGVGADEPVEAKNPVGNWGGFSEVGEVTQQLRDPYDW